MQRFKKILFVCDAAGAAPAVQDQVRDLARRNEAHVTLFGVAEGEPGDLARILSILPGGRGAEVAAELDGVRGAELADLAAGLSADGISADWRTAHGSPFLRIIETVLTDDYDLVIKAAEGDGERAFFGGTDMHLMRKCPCPVWIMSGAAAPSASKRILAAVDPDPEDAERDALNHTVMELATSLAARNDAKLDVINAWRVQEEHALRTGRVKLPEADVEAILAAQEKLSAERLAKLMEDFLDPDGRMRVLLRKGIAGDLIPEHVDGEGIDTIVMGTIGRSGVSGFFIGNTAETILGRVRCSVVTVKPPGFVSPVERPAQPG